MDSLREVIEEHQEAIKSIEKQLYLHDARERAGLPRKSEEWKVKAVFSMGRYQEELDALLDLAQEEGLEI